ncbi:MAG TPA: FecR domain-containing protein [Burkholderiaceae bacterium]|nr:FecR domain-containing protein [Burkholderiaceae bacterium]
MRVLLLCAAFAALPAAAAESEPSLPYVTQRSDTVIGLSRRLLVDPAQWREVARFNGLRDPNRIPVGATLRLPLRLLASQPAPARVEQVVGSARVGDAALRSGDSLPEGGTVQTARDGSVVLRLADGSELRLAADSRLRLERARRYPALDHVDSGVGLGAGRVEVRAARAQAGKPGFEVRTPQGVLGVRGTEYRVAVAAGEAALTAGEVLEGAVQFDGGDGPGRLLAAGFGTVIDAQRRVAEPSALLPPPDIRSMPTLHERLVLRFPVVRGDRIKGVRGLVARDREMREVLADNLAEGAELRFTGLDDGDYFLRVRAIDERGLEGRDAMLAFRLKARPEPPAPTAPPPRHVARATQVELAWTQNPEAQAYRLQVAADAGFSRVLSDVPALTGASHVLLGLAPGDYHWRLASVRAGNDQGPWGEPRAFVLRAPPANPPPPRIGDRTLVFAWAAEPGQTFDFQLARDAAFSDLVLERRLEQAEYELPRPPGGVYYMRVRARDADGFQGPFTAPQRFEIIDCLRSGEGECVGSAAGPLRRP